MKVLTKGNLKVIHLELLMESLLELMMVHL